MNVSVSLMRRASLESRLLRLALLLIASLFSCHRYSKLDQELFHAIRSDTERTEQLLLRGANPNATDESGWTPLTLAASRGDTGNVQALVRHAADRNLRNKEGFTPRNSCCKRGLDRTCRIMFLGRARLVCQLERSPSSQLRETVRCRSTRRRSSSALFSAYHAAASFGIHRRESILDARWWSVAELENSNELIFPERLATKLKKIIDSYCGGA